MRVLMQLLTKAAMTCEELHALIINRYSSSVFFSETNPTFSATHFAALHTFSDANLSTAAGALRYAGIRMPLAQMVAAYIRIGEMKVESNFLFVGPLLFSGWSLTKLLSCGLLLR